MKIDKGQIIDILTQRGDHDGAAKAHEKLPEQVDTETHGDMLSEVGVDPTDLGGGASGLGDRVGL